MSIATLIRRMADAGAPPEAIALAVEEIEAMQAVLDARKLADRERKRAEREARKTAIVHGQSTDSPQNVQDASAQKVSLEVPPQTPLPNPSKIPPPSPLKGVSPQKFSAPDGVTADQWLAFRKQRKKPINERSYTLLCNKLRNLAENGWPPGEMIDLAIERGWETVFEPKGFHGGTQRTDSLTAGALAKVHAHFERSGGAEH